jgi:hypothetical protein
MALQDMAAEWINRYAKKKPPAKAKQFYVKQRPSYRNKKTTI